MAGQIYSHILRVLPDLKLIGGNPCLFVTENIESRVLIFISGQNIQLKHKIRTWFFDQIMAREIFHVVTCDTHTLLLEIKN